MMSLLWRDSEQFLPINQYIFLYLRSSSSRFFLTWPFHRRLASKAMPRYFRINIESIKVEGLRWSRGSVLPLSTQVRRFKPGRRRQDFSGRKKSSAHLIFGGEVKPSVPCRRFAARKRSLNVTWKSTFRQNYPSTFSHTVPPFTARISRVVWTAKWERLNHGRGGGVQGSTISLIGCGASGAYAPGPDEEEE